MSQRRPRSLRKNIAFALYGNLGYTLSQFVMLTCVVHMTSTTTVGQYAYALALTAPVFLLAGLKLRHVQVTDARNENRPGEYVALRLMSSIVASAVCLGIALLSLSGEPLLILLAVTAFKAVEAQVDVLYGTFQRNERMDYIARSQVARAVVGASSFAVALWTTRSVPLAVSALTVATVAFLVRDTVTLERQGFPCRPEFSGKRLARLAFVAIPLGVSVSVGSLTTNAPRYFLDAFEGSEALGIFASIAYALVATGLIGGAVAEAASPRLANLYAANDIRPFRGLTLRLAAFGAALGLVGTVAALLVGEPLLRWLFGASYAAESGILVILMIAATVQYTSLAVGAAVYAMRQFRVQVPINLLGLLTAVVAAGALIKGMGLQGAAWSVVMTQVVLGLCYLVVFFVKVPKSHPRA